MTKPKEVAKTLKNVLNNELTEDIINRESDIFPIVDKVIDYWKFDLYSRKPGPVYDKKGTDLDMAAFLFSLVDRNAVICLPEYKNMRRTRVKENQVLTSKENRHGKIIGVYSNKNTFSFGVRIIDMNVIGKYNSGTDYVGDYRNFNLTNYDGEWYDGWRFLNFIPSEQENNFLSEFKQWYPLYNNKIVFKNFIHPNRWTSIYGQYYFITKMLIERLSEESRNYNQQIDRMLKNGIKLPLSDKEDKSLKQEKIGEERKEKVLAFNCEIDIPDNESEFPIYNDNQENLIDLIRKRKRLIYKTIPKLRFMTRASELAFFKYGINSDKKELFPHWLKNVKWERNYKTSSRSKTLWDRLVLFQPKVGEKGVSIRKRTYYKTETFSK